MKAHLFIMEGSERKLLAKVDGVEVVPRGLYVIDGEVYQYTGQPTFIIEKRPYLHGGNHALSHVELVVEKYYDLIEVDY
jgi:hypothetical protein